MVSAGFTIQMSKVVSQMATERKFKKKKKPAQNSFFSGAARQKQQLQNIRIITRLTRIDIQYYYTCKCSMNLCTLYPLDGIRWQSNFFEFSSPPSSGGNFFIWHHATYVVLVEKWVRIHTDRPACESICVGASALSVGAVPIGPTSRLVVKLGEIFKGETYRCTGGPWK